MRLLITRPEADSQLLARELVGLGHEAVIEPLLDIRYHKLQIDAGRYRAFLATSANGIRCAAQLEVLPALQELEMFAVGPASAKAAEEAGFKNVHVAGGDVTALAEKVAGELPADGKPLLHISGAAAAGDLKGDLEARGFSVERIIGYEAKARPAFSSSVEEEFAKGHIQGVLLYSPRTAVIFTRLIEKAELNHAGRNLKFFCLSQAVSDKLQILGKIQTFVADSPNQSALLNLIVKHG